MVIIQQQPAPQDPKQALQAMERGVFDAVLALSAALEKGVLAGFLIAPSTNGTMVELIFPPKHDAEEDAPNPSKKFEAATPAGVIAMAGEIMHQALMLEHQNNLNHGDYIRKVQEHRELRNRPVGQIIFPRRN